MTILELHQIDIGVSDCLVISIRKRCQGTSVRIAQTTKLPREMVENVGNKLVMRASSYKRMGHVNLAQVIKVNQ